MSASGSDNAKPDPKDVAQGGANHDDPPFVEHDGKETQLGYGDGGVPFYVAIVWVLFIIAYVAIMTFVSLPDFRAWTAR